MTAIINFNNGIFTYEAEKKFMVRTSKDAPEEDWKTALAQDIKPVPKGTDLVVDHILHNFYGTYLCTEYNGKMYNIDPRNCDFVGIITAR